MIHSKETQQSFRDICRWLCDPKTATLINSWIAFYIRYPGYYGVSHLGSNIVWQWQKTEHKRFGNLMSDYALCYTDRETIGDRFAKSINKRHLFSISPYAPYASNEGL